MPSISMSLTANYKTQSNAYDQLLIGKQLTNRTIMRLAREGRYGARFAAYAVAQPTRVSRPTVNRADKIDQLITSLLCD